MIDSPIESPESEIRSAATSSTSSSPISGQLICTAFGCFVLIVVPHFVAPSVLRLDEFGINAPNVLELFIAISDILVRTAPVSIVLSLVAILALELIGWLGAIFVVLFKPVIAIIIGLTG